jgi:hypothetical protein
VFSALGITQRRAVIHLRYRKIHVVLGVRSNAPLLKVNGARWHRLPLWATCVPKAEEVPGLETPPRIGEHANLGYSPGAVRRACRGGCGGSTFEEVG